MFSDPGMKAPGEEALAALTPAQRKGFITGLETNDLYYEYTFPA